MIISKLHVGTAAAVTCAIGIGLLWQIRANTRLRAEAIRQSAAATAGTAALEKQVAAQSQRLAAAEARVTALLKSAQLATAASAPPAPVNSADALKTTLAHAKALIADGKQQEALDEYVRCYRELQAIHPGSSECQSLMSAIRSLGRKYPPATTALAGLRDSAMAQRQTQPERRELVQEIAVLNDNLGEGYRTLALYDSLPPDHIDRQFLAMVANSSFIEARRYADALVGKPFSQMLSLIESGPRQIETWDASHQARMRESIITNTLSNIEVLTGAGKLDDARLLTEKLLALDNSEDTRSALARHLERARPNP